MKKQKILLVDDSKPILCLLEAILGKHFDVFAVNDGFKALDWLMKGNKPDLIISDLQMPHISGWELIGHLSSSSCYDNIPILILSGSDEKEIQQQCEKLRLAGYLTKPFDPSELLTKVNKILWQEKQVHKGFFLFG